MLKIPWIADKEVDYDLVQKLLAPSIKTNQLTNYGPAVKNLELYFRKHLDLEDDRCVIAVVNAATGLSVLTKAIQLTDKIKTLQWYTQDFTFPSAIQGFLSECKVTDFDQNFELNVDGLQAHYDLDGLIVTNLFGHLVDIKTFQIWAKKENKYLIFDNATAGFSYYNHKNCNNYGDGSIISLHHTKSIGFGEGGLIITLKKYEKMIRRLINFGFEVINGHIHSHPCGLNAKMSDISAAYIMAYLESNLDMIIAQHKKLYDLFVEKIKFIPRVKLLPNYAQQTVPNCFAVIFDFPIDNNHLQQFALHNVMAKKYYNTLKSLTILY